MKKNKEQKTHLWILDVQVKDYLVLSNPFWNHCCSILEDTGAREQSQWGKGTLVGVRGPNKSSAYLYWSRLELPTFHNGWWQYTRLARDEHLSLEPAGSVVCGALYWTLWMQYTTEIKYCPSHKSGIRPCLQLTIYMQTNPRNLTLC